MNFLSNLQNAIKEKSVTDNKRKWVKKGDIEKEKRMKLEEEKKKKQEEKQKEFEELEKKANEEITNFTKIEDEVISMDINEVKKRLREKDEPITLFGETDFQREKRLRKIEEQAEEQIGNTNIFGEIMEELESGESNYNSRDKKILEDMLPKEKSNHNNDIILTFFFVNPIFFFFFPTKDSF